MTNNSITLAAGEVKSIEIELSSLNDINSKYELFYETTNNSIKVGYDASKDLPIGTINANGKKTLIINLKNYSTTASGTVTFNAEGGFTTNNLVKSRGISIPTSSSLCSYTQNQVFNFVYNGTDGTDGSVQSFDTDFCKGTYQLEVWGAEGGVTTNTGIGGLGGYSKGNYVSAANQTLYIVVGGKPSSYAKGGYNGGGGGGQNSTYIYHGGGGGATHIATMEGLLSTLSNNKNQVLIVAGGGGGGSAYTYINKTSPGGSGGGLTTGTVTRMYYLDSASNNSGGNQDGTYTNKDPATVCTSETDLKYPKAYNGAFGQGAIASGGGWYGGAYWTVCNAVYPGTGGSGYIGGVTDGTSTAGQRTGHGYARITYLGK